VADTPIDERKFTDREVREILKKAVEKAPAHALARGDGLSLAELKEIGSEVGIDPARLDEAARDLVSEGSKRPNPVIGAPLILNFERRVEGEIDPDDAPQVLALIRRTMGQQGEASEIRGSLEWSVKGESGERFVTLTSKDGSTTVSGSANLTSAAVLTYVPPGLVGVISSAIGFTQAADAESQIGMIFFSAALPMLYLALRTILRKITSSESAKLQRVVDELARLAEGSGG
jgi:hypothetical protein